MKVKELIEKLKLEDEDAEVILSADEEGNYYSPLEGTLGFGKGYYIPNNTWSGEFLNQEYINDENELEGEIYKNNKDIAQKCIVLFPNSNIIFSNNSLLLILGFFIKLSTNSL